MKPSEKYLAGQYDLHCHSTASDGALSPTDIVVRAYEQGIRCLALTDHDSIDGLEAAKQSADQFSDMTFINGIEMTCQWRKRVIHVVGLGFTPTDELRSFLKAVTDLRDNRAEKICQKLIKKGLPDLLPYATKLADGGQIGRPHIARAMLELELVKNEQEAFDNYLGTGKCGDVKMEWPEIESVCDIVKKAGVKTVIAHPTKYRFSFSKLRELISDFTDAGGDGIEVAYGGLSPNHHRDLLTLASRQDIIVSAGSDFHSPQYHWTKLGRYPAFQHQKYRHILDQLSLV